MKSEILGKCRSAGYKMNVSLFLYSDAESGETKVELNKVSTSIKHYGVPDLAEVLGKRAPL